MKLTILLTIIILSNVNGSSILNWIWTNPTDDPPLLLTSEVPLVTIPYESMTEDEKFLQEASKITDIQISSPLETCQHRVIMNIRTSCSGMTEEDLAKLGVNLLNCQSAVEGRRMFPCNDKMSLKQCTTDMDADMWNAYLLMSNRARAVCYAARSMQFRALTELTVNKLMQSSQSQIRAFESIKENQDRLEEMTFEALTSLTDGNKVLLNQQQHLKDAQESAHQLVANNLRELNNEKALIRSGHKQLAAMTEDIKNRLDKASRQLLDQASERDDNHKEVLEDLMNIQRQAEMIWDKIESSTDRIVKQNAEAAAQFEQTLIKLEKINNTIHFIWNLTESMRTEVDQKLLWITDYIGDTGEQLQRVYRISLHIIYLLAAMIVAAFLHAPFLTRATIMALIPLNLVTLIKHGINACLDFTSITVLIILITAMHFVMVGIQRLISNRTNKTRMVEETDSTRRTVSNSHLPPRSSNVKSETPQVPKQLIYVMSIRLIQAIKKIYRGIISQLLRCKNNTMQILKFAFSWCQTSSAVEELSCSYLPSRKNRADVEPFVEEYPSLSEDDTNMDYYRVGNDLDRFNRPDPVIDWFSRPHIESTNNSTVSRSVTPTLISPRSMCNATTKTGARCRLFAQKDRYFCSRHRVGSSVLGDSIHPDYDVLSEVY